MSESVMITKQSESSLSELGKAMEATPQTERDRLRELGPPPKYREPEEPPETDAQKAFEKERAKRPPAARDDPGINTDELAAMLGAQDNADKAAMAEREDVRRAERDAEQAAEADKSEPAEALEYKSPERQALEQKWAGRDPLASEHRAEFASDCSQLEHAQRLEQNRVGAALAYLDAIGIRPKTVAGGVRLDDAITRELLGRGYTPEQIRSADGIAAVNALKEIGKDRLRAIAATARGSTKPAAMKPEHASRTVARELASAPLKKFQKTGTIEDLAKVLKHVGAKH